MKKFSLFAAIPALLLCLAPAVCSCGGDEKTPEYTFPDDDDDGDDKPEEGFIATELLGYPSGLKVWSFIDKLSETAECSGFIALVDPKSNGKLKFNAVHHAAQKTTSEIHAAYATAGRGTPQVSVNGGYWWDGNSLSLCVTGGEVKSIENQVVYRDEVPVYALRAGFGQMPAGGFEAQWIYCVADDGNKPYAFPSPMDNDEKTKTYMPAPVKSTTEGGAHWQPREAVGGGPMLVRGGKNVAVESYWRECFDGGGIAGLSRQPRTAVGATADGKVILLVCDGREMNSSKGYTLAELADRLIERGAVTAINLDGGGSSVIIGHEGKPLNRPSDSGASGQVKERKVSTAVVITLAG